MLAEAGPPLAGLRVLDFTRVVAGPYLTATLADMGCEILKVEPPEHGDDTRIHQPPGKNGEGANFLALNRSKRSVVLNLGVVEGRDIARRLARVCDILVENFRPGAMARLGLDYETLSAENPGLIYCSISGYNRRTEFRGLPGYDPVAQAETGLMYMTGDASMPPTRAGGSVVDALTGLHAGMGILAALHARGIGGRGQHVDVALYDSALATLGFVMQGPLLTGRNPPRSGNTSFFMAPNGVYACADGDVMISAGNNRLFAKLCAALDAPEIASDLRFRDNPARLAHVDELNAALGAYLRLQPRDHWVARLRDAGVPIGAVRTPLEALDAPETQASGIVKDVQHPRVGPMKTVGSPIHLSGTPVRDPVPAPLLGQHTEEVLRDILGLSEEELAGLRASSAIGEASGVATPSPESVPA